MVCLDVDGHQLPSLLLEELAEDDADIGIGGDGGGLDDLGEGDPGGAGDEDQPCLVIAGLDEAVAVTGLLLALLSVDQKLVEAAAAVGLAVDEGAVG